MSLYLHVGWPKNATSFLQTFFAINSNRLKSRNLVYPEIFDLSVVRQGLYGQGNGFSLAYQLLEDKSVTKCHYPKFDLLDLKLMLKAIPSSKKVLISSEWFTMVNEKGLCELRQAAEDSGHSVKIIGYIRPIIDFLESEYSQGLKLGAITEKFDDWSWHINYKEKLKSFASVFGEKHLIVRPFAKSYWVGSAIELDFMEQLGIDLDKIECIKPSNVNVSLNPKLLLCQRFLSKYSAGLSELDLYLIEGLLIKNNVLKKIEGSWISSSKKAEVLEDAKADIEYVELKYLNRGFLTSEFDSSSSEYEDVTVKEIESIVSLISKSPVINNLPEQRKMKFMSAANLLKLKNNPVAEAFVSISGI